MKRQQAPTHQIAQSDTVVTPVELTVFEPFITQRKKEGTFSRSVFPPILTSITIMQSFNDLFRIILEGDQQSSRKAARGVRKLLYSSKSEKEQYIEIKKIVNNADEVYRNIKEGWRQENFVMAVSVIYFLHDKENEQDFLFPWLFYLIQHDNGNIRQSAVRMFRNELGPLTVHIRCPENSFALNKIRNEKRDLILSGMHKGLHFLLRRFYKPLYKKYKYVSLLPTGQYKSIQLVLGELEDDCGEKYTKKLREGIN
ncbi:MAG: hypothetical protein A2V96_01415 [Candidatus Yonathbacteria bacterium RBG_16_43_6]|uniref:Uncharacterized protein n=2 Tax=Parcubacteria group TaxID=1794811 RepID=A0A1G2SBA5_9BACT|nr:MAG: hypothetical protein UW78_C0001G0013 [Candidatus Azambacteria bacterium GW2011_GWA1_44_9]OHA78557.1 MAG: hypothetical protein A2658_02095 [Candidatus Yonathbacteria bacterium RIFCSPHIGHO2_01_FULL_44_19]OHA80196.1 MAG: hypothetical protein A2V96_01415 [Candidatus Yonathbacteria bacterium RBG_16_43_6]OHA82295.1 MAG: hypothetical protein A3B07_02040 [Candidatus Yonathbacteria bacterium RIFCSPLOWO2_01_FULL_43_27]